MSLPHDKLHYAYAPAAVRKGHTQSPATDPTVARSIVKHRTGREGSRFYDRAPDRPHSDG
jgi:hypothetical protein